MDGTAARATLLGTTGAVLTGAAAAWLLHRAGSAWPGPGAVEVETGLWFLTTGAAGLLSSWVAVVLAAATAEIALRTRRSPGRTGGTGAPRGVGAGLTGRVAAGLLVLAGIGAAPATAAEVPSPATAVGCLDPGASSVPPAQEAPGRASTDAQESLEAADDVPVPGWTPTVPRAEPVRQTTAEVGLVSTTPTAVAQEQVVVHRGDTLWGIAARHLGEHATDQDVAEAWPRWYAVNRDVIGEDPDLLRPGQLLVVPAPGSTR